MKEQTYGELLPLPVLLQPQSFPVQNHSGESRVSKKSYRLLVAIFLGLLLTTLFTLTYTQIRKPSARQERPVRVFKSGRWMISLPAGGDLQAALNTAQPGDTIVLEAGAVYTGPFVLPAKVGTNTVSDYITIQSSRLSELPAAGTRVTPQHAPLMPRLVSPGGNNVVFRTEEGAHHYRLLGLEMMPVNPEAYVRELVQFGNGDPSIQNASTLARIAHHLSVERCYIHADGETVRGIALNSAHTRVLDSYIAGIKNSGFDAQAIAGWNGPGPYSIINNYLEASGENVAFGDGEMGRITPSDIEFRRNHLFKPLEWKGKYLIKNLFEIKQAERVLIEGNVFENCWAAGQAGTALTFTIGRATGAYITVRNNLIRRTGTGVSIANYGNPLTHHITIENNLFDEIGTNPTFNGSGDFIAIEGTPDVTVDHNTVIHSSRIVVATNAPDPATGAPKPIPRFRFTNNITRHNEYGIFGGGASPGNLTIQTYFPDGEFRRNVITNLRSWAYPADNFYPGTLSDVRFVDPQSANYRLAADSPYKGQATDGKDVGCDFAQLEAALAGSVTTSPLPSPTPAPAPVPSPTPVPTLLTPAPSPITATDRVNVALASQGASARASSVYNSSYGEAGVNDGDRTGRQWEQGGGWNDATEGTYADWVEVDFAAQKTINEVTVTTLQDDYRNAQEPGETQTFTKYGITDFEVQYWTGSSWAVVPGGVATNNNRLLRRFTFAPLATEKVRVVVNNALASYSRIVEVEAYQANAIAPNSVPSLMIFTKTGDGAGAGVVIDTNTFASGTFDVVNENALGSDKRTRLIIFATGVSALADDTNASNNVLTDGNTIENFAESVVVEARTRDGRTFQLPVEYAGAQFEGIDQVNFVLAHELHGSGTVELTLIVRNQRSNTSTVEIR